ncbi:hypothetical protein D9758_008806 [Tetrapyrgos nigripes]|uniref:Uncharacterized protein n=1 Tax=Tetrapyrgos nigripes TaxID=182062 RepID=A0A8H5FXT2_9AGAR|nr:hypothetical protein D9758_008806 [Tetrapyrgos nigripes]
MLSVFAVTPSIDDFTILSSQPPSSTPLPAKKVASSTQTSLYSTRMEAAVPSSATIEAFNNSSGNVFVGSHISVVGGNSINHRHDHMHHHHYSYHDHYHTRSLIDMDGDSVFDDFYTIKRANLFMIKQITEDGIYTHANATTTPESSESLIAIKTYNLVRIRGHKDIDSKTDFTSVTYIGPEALTVWKNDFDLYSQHQHSHVVQLFGMTRSSKPALLFHHELIPFCRVLQYRRDFSILASSYLRYRENVDSREAHQVLGGDFHNDHLWLNPCTHHFCFGPEGPGTSAGPYIMSAKSYPFSDQPFPLEKYSSISSLLQHFKTFEIDPFALLADQTLYDYYGNWDLRAYLEFIPAGSVVVECDADFAVIGHFPGAKYRHLYYRENELDAGEWISIRLAREDLVQSFRHQVAYIMKDKHIDTVWLVQANYIVQRFFETYKDPKFVHIRWLDLEIMAKTEAGVDNARALAGPSTVFLLCNKAIGSEDYGPRYFWAFDPLGDIPIPSDPEILKSLGIPNIEFAFQCDGHRFDKALYDELAHCHEFLGFDPDTQDLAKSRAYTLFMPRDEIKFRPMPENMDDLISF